MNNQGLVYMCPPCHYKIVYATNDWTNGSIYRHEKIDLGRALIQWVNLYQTYIELGVKVEIVEPKENHHEMTFLGDSIFIFGKDAIISNYMHQPRMIEAIAAEQWAVLSGFATHKLLKDMLFEGNAMCILWKDKLLMGYGKRTSKNVASFLKKYLNTEVIPLELKEKFFHLDIALFPLDEKTLVIYKDAFSESTYNLIYELADNVIEVEIEEADLLCLNSVVIGKKVIMSGEYPNLISKIRQFGYEPIICNASEFAKVEGGIKCLTLEHYKSEEGV